MTDIAAIPLDEMLRDRADAFADIVICQKALCLGITAHRDGYPVEERLRVNEKIVERIDAEIARRKAGAA